MNKETQLALICGARARQVLTEVVEMLADVSELPQMHDINCSNDTERIIEILAQIKKKLLAEGLADRVYPLNPFDGEDLRSSCRRIFGLWITNDVFGKGDWYARTPR